MSLSKNSCHRHKSVRVAQVPNKNASLENTTIDLPTYVRRVVMIPDVTYFYICREGTMSNYQHRSHIEKSEIQQTIDAMALVKQNTDRLKQKPYFHKRMLKVMKTQYYMCQSILGNQKAISPSFSNREIRDIMRSPLTFWETLSLKGWRKKNLMLYLLGVLPPWISVIFMRLAQCKSQ